MHPFCENFPFFCIMLSMLSAIISAVIGGKAAKWLSYCVSAACTVMSVMLLGHVLKTGESFVYMVGHFPAPWGNELRGGVLEAAVATAFSLVMLLSLMGGERHIFSDIAKGKINLYYTMADLILGALLALVYTNDMFTGYVFIEISTIASCGLLMIREIGRTTIAATRYMVLSLIGSGLTLIGITLLYDLTGHLLMSNMRTSIAALVESESAAVPLTTTIGLIAVGLSIKCGLFPFHTWMPDTYGYATPASSSILSGLVSKGYIFLLIKIFWRVVGFDVIKSSRVLDVLFIFGLAAIVFGSVRAIAQGDSRKMAAYSSATQIGYVFVGIGLGSEAGFVAAIFHIFCHAVTKPLLFTTLGALSDVSGGSKLFADLQGSGKRDPLAGIGFTVGALSMVGLPLFSGFISKLLIATASLGNPKRVLPTLVVLAISVILNAMYFMRTVLRIYRPSDRRDRPERKHRVTFVCSVVCLIGLNLFLGLVSQPVTDALELGLRMFS